MIPVPASGWLNTELTDEQRAGLVASGIIPVNDVYMPLWHNDSTDLISIIRGGRGGGKSEAVADNLLDQCRSQDYFKCYYGRKVFETVRGSQFDTLIHSIRKNYWQREFHFSEANTSSMVITHRRTGNKFMPFGSDKAVKLKSIKDPTHLWLEEADDFTLSDFMELLPVLRTERGRRQLIMTLNTHGVYPDHWLIKVFFPDLYTGQDKSQYDMLEGMNVQHILANFPDNHYIDHEKYERQLRMAAAGNERLFRAIAYGEFGANENGNPWLYNFNYDTHTRDNIPFFPRLPVYISFDFNNDPFAATAWQFSEEKGTRTSFIHCINEFSGMVKIEDMCSRIRSTYPNSLLFVTGDRSGSNEDIGRNQTLYQMIAGLLRVPDRRLNLNSSNLTHADSRVLLNTMMHHYPHLFIDRRCVNLIRQCQAATVDQKTDKAGKLLKDREGHKNDEFDSMRYFFQTYFNEFCKRVYTQVLYGR